MKRLVSVPLSCMVLVACGGAPPPPPTLPVATVTAPVEPPPAPVVDEAAEPKGLIAVARWSSPVKGIDQILKLFGVTTSLQDRLLKEAADVSSTYDFDASVDLAVTLDPDSTDAEPKVNAAISLPFKSLDAVKASAEKEGKLTPQANGVLRMASSKSEKIVCDITPAAGDAPVRVVCGTDAHSTDLLRPWLSRGLPKAATPANEMAISIKAAPFKDRYFSLLRKKGAEGADEARKGLSNNGIQDPELLGAAGVIVDESLHFLDDLDGIDVRLSFRTQPPELIDAAILRFGGKTSWITHVLTDPTERAGTAPAAYWRLPKDATSATWSHGSDPKSFDGIRRVLHKAIGEALAKTPLPEPDKEALEKFVDGAPRPNGAWVSAQGAILPKGHAAKRAAGAPIDLKELASTAIGWTISGVEAPAADYIAWAKQGVDVYGRAIRIAHDFVALTNKDGKDADEIRKIAPKVTILTSPAGWPKGTVAIDTLINADLISSFADKKKAKGGAKVDKSAKPAKPATSFKGTLTLRVAIVPDGERTWIGFSADPEELKKRINLVVAGGKGTLTERDGLEALKGSNQTWGGFFSFGDVLERAVESIEREKPEKAADARTILDAMPNHGRTPVLFIGTGTAGDKPTNSAEVRFEGGTLADVVGLVKLLESDKGKALLKKF
jgi:hypothetical protein